MNDGTAGPPGAPRGTLDASVVAQNESGRLYVPGRAYSLEVKVELRNLFLAMADGLGRHPTPHELKQAGRCSDDFARKIIFEIVTYGDVVDPKALPDNRPRGVGSKSLTPAMEQFILDLRREKPTRPIVDYVLRLHEEFGRSVSEGTMSEWFKRRWQFNASKKKTSNVPTDKWSDANTQRYLEYLAKMLWMDPKRVKFSDEKLLKGADFFDQNVRPDPVTGEMPTIDVDPDFRNAYSIMGVMQAGDPYNAAVVATIGEENGDSESFLMFMIELVSIDYFNHGDILVLDNCKIHSQGLCDILEDFLWNTTGPDGVNPLQVLIVWLPTRSPELNPIELVWNILVQRLKTVDLYDNNRVRRNAAPRIAEAILRDMAHDHGLMMDLYCKCGYFRNW